MRLIETPPWAGGASRLSSRVLITVAVAPLVTLALWHLRAPLDLSIGDQAHYLLHADAMLDGRSYTDNGYIHYPPIQISPGAYPPGLPLLLAVAKGLGGSLFVMRLLMVVGAAIFFYVAARYLASFESPSLGSAAVFVCAFVPQIPLFASGLYTDFIFGALVWGCCLLADRPGEWGPRRIAWLCALGALAIAFRTVGVALVPALMAYQIWRSWRHSDPWKRAIAPLAVWLLVYVAIDFFFPSRYMQQITSVANDASEGTSHFALPNMLLERVLAYRALLSEVQLTPLAWPLARRAYHLAALLFLLMGAVIWTRRAGVRFLFCFIVCYMGILLVVPWANSRSLWPLLPAIWFGMLEGIRAAARLVTPDRARAVRVSLASAALVVIVTLSFGPRPEPLIGVGDIPEGRALYAALAAEAARGPVRTLFFSPRDPARMPRVSGMAIPHLPPDAMLAELRAYRITHAILGSLGNNPEADQRLRETIRHRPERFQKVYENGKFTLYRVVPTAAPMPATLPPHGQAGPTHRRQ